jgi:hypothetical protein
MKEIGGDLVGRNVMEEEDGTTSSMQELTLSIKQNT